MDEKQLQALIESSIINMFMVYSVARTEKQNIAQFSPKIAQNEARSDLKIILPKNVAQKSPLDWFLLNLVQFTIF